MKRIGIIGCGWLGLHLAKHLSIKHEITCTNTSKEKCLQLNSLGFKSIDLQFSDAQLVQSDRKWSELGALESIIICIPFSRNLSAEQLLMRFTNLTQFLTNFKGQVLLMSSIGIYPSLPQQIDETTLEDSLLNASYLAIENLLKKALPQVMILRLAGLMGDDRFLSKYPLKDPEQAVNHVHYVDICRIVEAIIANDLRSKTYNVVAPLHPTKQEVVDYQLKGIEPASTAPATGRIICGKKLQDDLEYTFVYPNPLRFSDEMKTNN